MFQTVISAFIDEFPKYLQNRKVLVTGVMCMIEFILGIPCITQGGIYFLQIMDWYSSCFSLMILSLIECLVISWVYGVDRFYKDIELMIGYQPGRWWKAAWGVVTPITIVFVLGFSITTLQPVTYGDYHYPEWAIGVGWIFALCSMVPVPVVAIIYIAREKGTLIERIKKLAKPAPEWGPALDQYRELYIASLNGESRENVQESCKSSPIYNGSALPLVEKVEEKSPKSEPDAAENLV